MKLLNRLFIGIIAMGLLTVSFAQNPPQRQHPQQLTSTEIKCNSEILNSNQCGEFARQLESTMQTIMSMHKNNNGQINPDNISNLMKEVDQYRHQLSTCIYSSTDISKTCKTLFNKVQREVNEPNPRKPMNK